MKVLLLNQFFWPDSSATSQLLTDVARALVEKGHHVTAVSSAAGGYVEGDTVEGAPEVDNLRVRGVRFGRGKLGRLLSYASFYAGAAWTSLRLEKQDLVLSLTTPPLISLVGTLMKLVRGSRHVIWEMDMYPEVATDLGYFRRHGLADRLSGYFADVSRNRADLVIALGECMEDRLAARGLPRDRVRVVHNWADGDAITPLPRAGDPAELVLLYSGNLGLAHDIDTLATALTLLDSDPRFRFLFVGGGNRRAALAETVARNSLSNVHLLPYVSRTSLGDSLSAGDIGVVTQRDECCGAVVPSKVYGLLAAGRPILFIGPAAATPARIIEQFGCGWHVPVGDAAGLHQLLLHLAANRGEVREKGIAARHALDAEYDIRYGLERILSVLEDRDENLKGRSRPVRLPAQLPKRLPEQLQASPYEGEQQTCML